ncbi:hypothetical protein F5X99DRAFT_422648 [Biscogniauxia marginata]|nr:hypothetical protein F5X99DRAFT_422648 [Biscogniauxia marginata]
MPPTARKAHNKSRAGCEKCKSKKIKCDEKQPCSYCVKRRLPCSLQPEPKTAPTALVFRQPDPPSFTFADFGLFQHFVKSTAGSHSDDDASRIVWSETVPDLAVRYPYLMHELLAVAAIHRGHTHPEEVGLQKIAAEHQSRAIPLFRQALAGGTGEDAIPLFACSCLIIPYYFAAARDATALLCNEEANGPPEWLMLIEGCAAITIKNSPAIMGSPLRALLGEVLNPGLEDLTDSFADRELVGLKHKLPLAPEHRAEYATVLDRLRVSYTLSDQATGLLARKNAALRFPPSMGRLCKDHLAAKEPAALIIIAFWCVLLYRVEDRWWLRGRMRPLLVKIVELLPSEYHHLISWPLEQLDITPPSPQVIGDSE